MVDTPLFPDPPRKTVYDLHRAECAATAKLFVPVAPGSITSAAAAASLSSTTVAKQESIVLDAIVASPTGLTCDAVEAATGLRHQSASARIWGLRQRGILVDSGQTAYTRSGRHAVVWTRHDR